MPKQLIINKIRTINASPDKVWEIITKPQFFNEWMFVPGQVPGGSPLQLGSKIQWINNKNIVYLQGEVIEFVPERSLVISLRDISWPKEVVNRSVTYEFHLKEERSRTNIQYLLGDLAIDPEGEAWYNAYSSSDEIGAIEKILTDKAQAPHLE